MSSSLFAAINIYKPKGLTSHDVVARLRRIFGLKKVGHLGTLDPLAEGVLPVCLGQATRLIEYFPTEKRYTAEVTLGRTTTTLDSEGDELSKTDCRNFDLSEVVIQAALRQWTGVITQQVPLYSAVHVGGQKLYKLARKQEKHASEPTDSEKSPIEPEIELPSREVTIYSLNLLGYEEQGSAHPVLRLDVACSSGTYIRSLARDIGATLGCGAYMSGLLRTEHGRFNLSSSVTLETLQASDNPHQYLLDPAPLLAIPTLTIAWPDDVRLLCNGMKIHPSQTSPDGAVTVQLKPGDLYLATDGQHPLGIVQVNGPHLKPLKIFPH